MAPDTDGAVEHRLEVVRTARYFTLGPESAPDVWIVLHGYRQLARRFLRRFSPLDDGARRIVAPEALSRFYVGQETGRHGPGSRVGATWMTREAREDEIRDYVAYLDRVGERVLASASRTTVLGFSQGVATAARWVALGSVRPRRLVLWGDTLPPDLPLERLRPALDRAELILVRGERDPAVGPERWAEEARRLEGAGVAHRTVSFPGGHEIDAATLTALGDTRG